MNAKTERTYALRYIWLSLLWIAEYCSAQSFPRTSIMSRSSFKLSFSSVTNLLKASDSDCFILRALRMNVNAPKKRKDPQMRLKVFTFIGMTGFEPAASRTPSERATRLRHIPCGLVSPEIFLWSNEALEDCVRGLSDELQRRCAP